MAAVVAAAKPEATMTKLNVTVTVETREQDYSWSIDTATRVDTLTTYTSAAGVITHCVSTFRRKDGTMDTKQTVQHWFKATGKESITVSAAFVKQTLAEWNGEEVTGAPCMIYAMGNWYNGVVLEQTTKRVTVRFTTKAGAMKIKTVSLKADQHGWMNYYTPEQYAVKLVEWKAAAEAHRAAGARK